MFKTKSIYQLIVYSLSFIIIFISLFTFIIVENTRKELQQKVKIQKKEYIKNQKNLLKKDVNQTINFIKYYHNKYQNLKNITILKKEILETLEEIKKTNNMYEYTFIYKNDGTLIFNSISKDHLGKNNFSYQDSTGKYVIKELIRVSKNMNGGFLDYFWDKPNIKKDTKKISYAKSYTPLNWTIAKGVYLDEINTLTKKKQQEFNTKIFNYSVLILTLTVLLLLYSIFIYKNAKAFILSDVKLIEKYFKQSQENDSSINFKKLQFGEFKKIANYATQAINSIKIKNQLLEDLNKNLETKVEEKTEELTKLIASQKSFIKNSVHEVNTPLSIIQTNVDLLKMRIPNNKYITHIESGTKIIQYIYDDLSYLIKKDRIVYKKEYLNFSEILKDRIYFFEEIASSNSLKFEYNVEDDIYLKFNNTELKRIIDNNVSNAIKYSFKDSIISVKLYYISDYEIELDIITNSQKIENINKIFNDFYRENNNRGGFGLGLKIVKDICDKNSVIIDLKSNEEQTKFTYRFKINENTTT